MKNIFTSAFLFLTVTSFAQDTKKDTGSIYDYGARIYDARIGRYMAVDPNVKSPYSFSSDGKLVIADTTQQPLDKPKKKITAK